MPKTNFQQSSSFTHHKATLHIYQSGNPNGPPVVFIHGLSGSRSWWRKNLPAFQQYNLYVLELPGYGKGRGQRALSVHENAKLIGHWLNRENLHGFSLIGHSMGGQISMHVAAQAGRRVHRLVLVNSSGLLMGHTLIMALRLPQAGINGRLSFVPQVVMDGMRAGIPNLWSSSSNLLKDSLDDILPKITAQTLIIWGSHDVVVPKALGQALSQKIPNARYHELAGGHVIMVDAAEEFNALVLDFLRAPVGEVHVG